MILDSHMTRNRYLIRGVLLNLETGEALRTFPYCKYWYLGMLWCQRSRLFMFYMPSPRWIFLDWTTLYSVSYTRHWICTKVYTYILVYVVKDGVNDTYLRVSLAVCYPPYSHVMPIIHCNLIISTLSSIKSIDTH